MDYSSLTKQCWLTCIAGGLFVFQSSVFRISEKLHNGKQGFALTKKRPCYPISDWIAKAEYSVVPLCIIIPVTRYNLLTLSKPNSFSCNVKTTSRLTIDFSGMLPGDITNYHLPHLTCLRLSVIRFLLWPVLFYAFLFFIYLKFYSFFYKISRDNLYIFYNYR